VTDGIISSIRGKSQLLQITAAISPDSSGSPIFNTKGEVIGVATFLLKGDPSLNFAVPVSLVQDLLKHPKKRSTSEAALRLTRQQQLMTTKPAPHSTSNKYRSSSNLHPLRLDFFSMGVDEDAALYYSPESVHISGNKVELMVKWTYLQKQGPTYSNSQKIIKLAQGNIIIPFLRYWLFHIRLC
jgi:hypothetical protein